jgi:NAD(P) transhydrogenase subunit alpha
MQIFVPKEVDIGETRAAMVPSTIKKLIKLGAEVEVEAGIGASICIPDEEYKNAGSKIAESRANAFSTADMVLRLRKPREVEISGLKRGAIHVSYLDLFNEQDLVRRLASSGVSAVSMEMIPRSTVAQKMDALSSQANLAGYVAVIVAADKLNKIFPMMMTPSGTIAPIKVFIIGVGVAGLQAIATAKRLGAKVEAFDTRPVVEEQVKSLGAKFVKVDLGETGQTAQGYAKELTPEQIEKQRVVMAEHCAGADVVITTAQLFGRKAPRILTTAMVQKMKPGSVVVDLAVETGGNVECSELGKDVVVNGVHVLGLANLPGRVALAASEMYSNNLGNFVEHFWDKEKKTFKLDPQNEILKSCLVTHDGKIVNESIKWNT